MTAPEAPRNLPYELGLLEKISSVTVNGTPLRDVPIFGEYALWHRFVQFVFSSDIRRFAAQKSFDEYKKGEGGAGLFISLKGFLVGLFGLVISSAAWFMSCITHPQVVVFGIDRVSDAKYNADFRIRALHSYLRARGISCIECFHTVFNASFVQNFFTRLRFAFYLESLDTLYAIVKRLGLADPQKEITLGNLDAFAEEEKRFASYIIKKYLGEERLIVFRVSMLTRFLKDSGAKAVWAIDDARYYHDIALAGKRAGIPVYAFQHGHFTKYHLGWLVESLPSKLPYIRPDYLLVWSEYWKKELTRLKSVFSLESIIESGYPNEALQLPKNIGEGISILVPHETDAPREEVEKFLNLVLATCPEASLIMKFRPDHSEESQKSAYPNLPWGTERLSSVTNLSELSVRPNIVLGVYSSFLYDMVRAEVPVALIDVGMDYGQAMIENGLADQISDTANLPILLRGVAATPVEVLAKRRDTLGSSASFQSTLDSISRQCGIGSRKTVG